MYLERMVLMTLDGNGEAEQVSINIFSAESWIRMNYKNFDVWYRSDEICHFNAVWNIQKPLCWLYFSFKVPSAPSSLKIVNPTLDSLTLEWEPPSHPNGILTEYTLKYQPSKLWGERNWGIWLKKEKILMVIFKYKQVVSLQL